MAATEPDVNALTAQYKAVGAELRAFSQTYGEDAASDYQTQYRMIRFAQAVSSQPKRDAAAAILAKIHAGLAHKPH